jgi:hypothetical protein
MLLRENHPNWFPSLTLSELEFFCFTLEIDAVLRGHYLSW